MKSDIKSKIGDTKLKLKLEKVPKLNFFIIIN